MDSVQRQLKAIREIGEITVELFDVGSVPASFGCPADEEGHLILEEDDRYREKLEEMISVLRGYATPQITNPQTGTEAEPWEAARAITVEKNIAENVRSKIDVEYRANGLCVIEGSIINDGSERQVIDTFLNHGEEGIDNSSPVDIGRLVARAELIFLTEHLGSSADTIDYWMMEESPGGLSKMTQSDWAKIRGVSRQAINGRISSAKQKLEEEN